MNPFSKHALKQVLKTFDVAITDAANNPIAGVALTESITLIQRKCVAKFPPITGTATTNAKGLISDIYFVPFIDCCCSGGSISLKQTITAGTVSAVFYTTIDKTGAWTGNLRSVFH